MGFEPRLAVKYFSQKDFQLKAGYDFTQTIHSSYPATVTNGYLEIIGH
jgi:hypothetical protein